MCGSGGREAGYEIYFKECLRNLGVGGLAVEIGFCERGAGFIKS